MRHRWMVQRWIVSRKLLGERSVWVQARGRGRLSGQPVQSERACGTCPPVDADTYPPAANTGAGAFHPGTNTDAGASPAAASLLLRGQPVPKRRVVQRVDNSFGVWLWRSSWTGSRWVLQLRPRHLCRDLCQRWRLGRLRSLLLGD